eukprot:Phypoly_transcript_05944.p1 GENE.Phypoly_transcript_05944~~Phypoly_transcript_05944.p1  ORF type:complete len:576 (+),score=97.47 Phypoly_transcript_05944:116-1843(+)
METNHLLHDITLLERKLHGIITQRECLGVNTKEAEETEGALKKSLADKKQRLRSIMEEGGPAMQPRQPAFIKNGVSLEMLHQIVEMEDKLCSILPVMETDSSEPTILATLSGPAIVSNTPDDGTPNLVSHPPPSTHVPPRVAACSVSTYPHVPEIAGTGRQGDPICDRFCVQIHKNSSVVALADGCNWGRLPYEAANRATTAFVEYLEERITKFTSLRRAGSILLAALSAANKKITEGLEQWECGTTTLIGGVLLPVLPTTPHAPPIGQLPRSSSWSSSNSLPTSAMPPTPGRTRAGSSSATTNSPNTKLSSSSSSSSSTSASSSSSTTEPTAPTPTNKWVFVCVSLGDCKAFHYSQRLQQFTDITEGNRQNLTDARDPGGRLGPYIEANPDLRNLHLYYHLAEPDDIIFLLSDGIHDNLDPQQLGIAPPETKSVVATSWEEAEKIDPETVEAFKNNFRKKWLEDTFAKQLLLQENDSPSPPSHTSHSSPSPLPSPSTTLTTTTTATNYTRQKSKLDVTTVIDVLLKHCVNITKTSREFMEQNPKSKLPPDFKQYPGKLDHATCVCLTVGTNDKL